MAHIIWDFDELEKKLNWDLPKLDAGMGIDHINVTINTRNAMKNKYFHNLLRVLRYNNIHRIFYRKDEKVIIDTRWSNVKTEGKTKLTATPIEMPSPYIEIEVYTRRFALEMLDKAKEIKKENEDVVKEETKEGEIKENTNWTLTEEGKKAMLAIQEINKTTGLLEKDKDILANIKEDSIIVKLRQVTHMPQEWIDEIIRITNRILTKPVEMVTSQPCNRCGKSPRNDFDGICMDCADELGVSELFAFSEDYKEALQKSRIFLNTYQIMFGNISIGD